MGVFAPTIKNLIVEGPFPLTASRLTDLFSGPPTGSGVRVNEQSALGIAAVWSCVRLISETIGSLPWILYERVGDRGKVRAVKHPLYRLLDDEPNPWMTSMSLRETLMGHLLLRGNAFCEIERDPRDGMPTALWPLRPDRMSRIEVSQAGTLLYHYTMPSGEQKTLSQTQVLHLRGLGNDGVSGYAPITIHRETLAMSLAVQQYGGKWFGQGARPGGVLKAKQRMSPEAINNLRSSWNNAHEGISMAGRIAVLEEGVEWQQIGMSAVDAEYLGSHEVQVQDVARIFRVPPHKIADMARSTFNNIEKQALEFITDTLRPWCVRIEQQVQRDLIPSRDRDTLFSEFLMDGLLRGDLKARYEAYARGRQNGWLSGNDVRELENMNPIEGGDDYWRPVNMAVIGAPATQPALAG